MPSLTKTNTHANPNYAITDTRARGVFGLHQDGIPPYVVEALELLFLLYECRTGNATPIPGWFLAEAFAAQQYKDFRPSEQLQHFLQRLLGSRTYGGAQALETYLVPVACACVLHAMMQGKEEQGIAAEVVGGCRACLMRWGYRQRERDAVLKVVHGWVHRTIAKMAKLSKEERQDKSILSNFLRRRGAKLAIVLSTDISGTSYTSLSSLASLASSASQEGLDVKEGDTHDPIDSEDREDRKGHYD